VDEPAAALAVLGVWQVDLLVASRGALDNPASARDVDVVGDLAYVADLRSVRIIDVGSEYIPVPEPSTWLLLVAGAGLLGMLYRQRRR